MSGITGAGAVPFQGARARSRAEGGQASLEMVGLIPVLLVTLVVVVQIMALAYTAHAASQAARDAARAFSLDESPVAAAQASLPGAVRLVNVGTYGPDHGVTVTVQSPPVLLLTRTVVRSVTMP